MTCNFSFAAGESEVPGREQRLSVHQESGGQDQRRGRESNTLSGQNHRGSCSQGTESLSASLSLCPSVSVSVSASLCVSPPPHCMPPTPVSADSVVRSNQLLQEIGEWNNEIISKLISLVYSTGCL